MVDHNAAVLIYRNALALFCAAGIAVSPVAELSLRGAIATKQSLLEVASLTKRVARNDGCEIDSLARANLWQYLRTGINYLEASGRDVPIHYKHPGGKAYGPLALTPIAIKDVRLHYPLLSAYTLDNVLSDRELYEKFAAAYAELLLKHYFRIDFFHMPKEEVFEALQKGWFLGPTLYKKGRPVIASRQTRAAEYIDSPLFII
ncbi:MAG: hypothetical protein NTY34_03340 [Candidatus Omnitrophica bacterium]|nr:hypothetical protein [Candidatus Omnitrophota bacterium]